MTIPVQTLLARLRPRPRLVVGTAGLGRDVARVRDLRQAGNGTTAGPGDALVVHAAELPDEARAQRELLTAWGSAALVAVELPESGGRLPIGFLSLAEGAELPLITARAPAGDLAAALSRGLAADPAPDPAVGDTVRRLAKEMRAEVYVLDTRLGLVAASHPEGPVGFDALRAVLPAGPLCDPLYQRSFPLTETGRRALVRAVVEPSGRPAGILAVIRRQGFDAAAYATMTAACTRLAQNLAVEQVPSREELHLLWTAEHMVISQEITAEVWGDLVGRLPVPSTVPLGVMLLTGAPSDALYAATAEAWGIGGWLTAAEHRDGLTLVARHEVFLDGASLVAGVAAGTGRPVHAGLARLDDLAAFGTVHAAARTAAGAAAHRGVPLVEHGELGWQDLLTSAIDVHGVRTLRASLTETFATVPGGDDLLETLRTWAREAGRTERAAERLGVHRHTVNNRLRRAESVLGTRLDATGESLGLWLLVAGEQ